MKQLITFNATSIAQIRKALKWRQSARQRSATIAAKILTNERKIEKSE